MTSKKKHKADLKTVDPVWNQIRSEAEMLAAEEPFMASLAHSVVLHHHSLEHALSYRLAQKLSSPEMSPLLMREMADSAYADDPYMGEAGRADVMAVHERDPAATGCCSRYSISRASWRFSPTGWRTICAGMLARSNSRGATSLTRTSVHCADSRTLISRRYAVSPPPVSGPTGSG